MIKLCEGRRKREEEEVIRMKSRRWGRNWWLECKGSGKCVCLCLCDWLELVQRILLKPGSFCVILCANKADSASVFGCCCPEKWEVTKLYCQKFRFWQKFFLVRLLLFSQCGPGSTHSPWVCSAVCWRWPLAGDWLPPDCDPAGPNRPFPVSRWSRGRRDEVTVDGGEWPDSTGPGWCRTRWNFGTRHLRELGVRRGKKDLRFRGVLKGRYGKLCTLTVLLLAHLHARGQTGATAAVLVVIVVAIVVVAIASAGAAQLDYVQLASAAVALQTAQSWRAVVVLGAAVSVSISVAIHHHHALHVWAKDGQTGACHWSGGV